MTTPCSIELCKAHARWAIDVPDEEVGTVFMFACPDHLPEVLDKSRTNTVRHIGLFRRIMEALGFDYTVSESDRATRSSGADGVASGGVTAHVAGEGHGSTH